MVLWSRRSPSCRARQACPTGQRITGSDLGLALLSCTWFGHTLTERPILCGFALSILLHFVGADETCQPPPARCRLVIPVLAAAPPWAVGTAVVRSGALAASRAQ